MISWIMGNMANIIITLILVLIVGGIIFSMIRNKKQGRSNCGCGCEHCSGCAAGRTTGSK